MLQSEHFLQRIGFASGLVLNNLNSSVLCLSLMQRVCRRPNHLNTPDKTHRRATYESTWFSKDRMTGYGEVLKALSAMASITSCSQDKNDKNSKLDTIPQHRFCLLKITPHKIFYKSKKWHKTATDQADEEETKNVKESRIVPVTFLQQLPP